MNEIWKDIPDYEGLYQASNLGRIKSLSKKIRFEDKIKNEQFRKSKDKILSLNCFNNFGYLIVHLRKNNKSHTKTIHRLVLESFIGKSELVINHKDGNKLNNKLNNLEYCTISENGKHAWRTGLMKNAKIASDKYRNITLSRCWEKNKRPIDQFDLNGKLVNSFSSIKEAVLFTGITSIYGCVQGKQKTAGGFIFKGKS